MRINATYRIFYFILIVLPAIAIIMFYSPCDFIYAQSDDFKKEKLPPYVPNEILVRFIPDISEEKKEAVRQSLGATLVKTINTISVEYWRLPPDTSTEAAMEYLRKLPIIQHTEPNNLSKPMSIPNDPEFNKLWHLRNTGQEVNGIPGVPGADISIDEAWNLETGSPNMVIAVIDTGVAFEHPDLSNNIWLNTDEISGNGIDDDNNGYIDDIVGWDFVNNDNNPSDYSKDLYGNGHGTHVAGIIAAQGNNGIGVTGVMWRCKIMPLQIFDLFEINSFLDSLIQEVNIILAIEYAVDNGAKIINCSFGGGSFSQFTYDMINYANQNGVLIVAAAGNDGSDNDVNSKYPSSYDLPNIISVAATNASDELSSYSNYGIQSVDVAAPGGNAPIANIYSTVPPERETLFYDDFESGGSKWLTSGIYENWSLGYSTLFGSTVIQDSVGYYHTNENSWLATASPIAVTQCKGLHFELKYYKELENTFDYLYMELSKDGINYIPAGGFTGFSSRVETYREWADDQKFTASFYLRFRLSSDSSFNYDGVYIDDIAITGIPWVFDGNEYGYKSGTSMAAPVVSGVAGLLWSYVPELTLWQVKQIIIQKGDKLNSLNDKIYFGNRVNAYKALLFITDNDEMPQNWELTYFYTCSRDGTGDYDSDGLNDLREYQSNTNPTIADTDDDGLNDGEEVNVYSTNPNDPDTDDDSMPDVWEVKYELNPLVNDAGDDADGDGYSNIIEFKWRTLPNDPKSYPPKYMPWLPLLLGDD